LPFELREKIRKYAIAIIQPDDEEVLANAGAVLV
jgi:hypothetical protein